MGVVRGVFCGDVGEGSGVEGFPAFLVVSLFLGRCFGCEFLFFVSFFLSFFFFFFFFPSLLGL